MKLLSKSASLLEKVRADIYETTQKLEDLKREKLSREEALNNIDRFIASKAEIFDRSAYEFAESRHTTDFRGFQSHVNELGFDEFTKSIDASPAFCALVPEAIKARITAAMDEQASYGTPMKDRPKIKVKLEGQLFKLEQQEESIVREMEASGVFVERRADIVNVLLLILLDEPQLEAAA
ncbi:hypothetical protein ACUNV4_10365 [Granulosicoccus sp. 3-233]|uniref:hypothetical protein n=1 Tax=Granulosicoccus sp. 3-233 TaxID=3417969 RepID=UPI003D329B4F